jgi:hypothetical protein
MRELQGLGAGGAEAELVVRVPGDERDRSDM